MLAGRTQRQQLCAGGGPTSSSSTRTGSTAINALVSISKFTVLACRHPDEEAQRRAERGACAAHEIGARLVWLRSSRRGASTAGVAGRVEWRRLAGGLTARASASGSGHL